MSYGYERVGADTCVVPSFGLNSGPMTWSAGTSSVAPPRASGGDGAAVPLTAARPVSVPEGDRQSTPVPFRHPEKLRERAAQQRLAGLHVPASSEEGQPDVLADAHLGFLQVLPQHMRPAQPPHQHAAQLGLERRCGVHVAKSAAVGRSTKRTEPLGSASTRCAWLERTVSNPSLQDTSASRPNG